MYVDFEIAALFRSPYSRVKKRANFKTNIHLDSVESFLALVTFTKYDFLASQKFFLGAHMKLPLVPRSL